MNGETVKMGMDVMTGRERVLNAIRCQAVDRVPWVPFVGSHAGALLDVSAEAYFRSADLMVQGMQAAIAEYQPDGVPVTFDLQLEAEELGCELVWSDDNPPAVVRHPLANGTVLSDLKIPASDQGRIKLVMAAAASLRAANPEIGLYGLITGPFTLALHLLGTDIFMKMFDDVKYVHELLAFCRDVAIAMSQYYIDAGCDVVAVVDPMTSQIGPEQFEQFVSPYVAPVFDFVREKGRLSSFFVCGHAEKNIEVMCDCRCDNISIDENIPLEFVRDVCMEKGVSFGGNIQLTTTLLLGTPVDAQKNAIACLEVGGGKGFILAPGCDLPYATPVANLKAIREIMDDPYKRDVVKAMETQGDANMSLDMKEYGQYRKVIVDIITLDSEACAPCQYMVDSVKKVVPEFEGIVEWREHKIKYRESLVFMASLMVHNVPTICIDGQIAFVSRIPARDELIAAIQKRIIEKFRMKIQRRQGAVYLLGPDSEAMTQLEDNVEQAIAELGSDMDIHRVVDEEKIMSYGILPEQTPSVVMARYRLKSSRYVPDISIIKEWIKDV